MVQLKKVVPKRIGFLKSCTLRKCGLKPLYRTGTGHNSFPTPIQCPFGIAIGSRAFAI